MSGRQDTLFRHLTLLQLIPRAPHYRATTTLQTLLEERGFKMELRTLQRDLEKLSAHFPLLKDDSHRPFRWSFDPAFKSNLPAMDTATALTLVLAEEYLRGLLPQIAIDQLAGQFENARKYLEGMGSNGFAHWSQRVKAIPNGKALIPAPIHAEVWQKVTDALLDGQALEVEYLSRSKNEVKSYRLHPLGLVARHSVTYLLATVNDYEDVRQFALHRFQSIETSTAEYRARPEFDLKQYIEQGAFGYPVEDGSVRLKARVRGDVAWRLAETPVSTDQTLSEPDADGWVMLEADVPNDQQTQWWIQGFGSAIDVIEPRSWREAIHQQAREVLGLDGK